MISVLEPAEMMRKAIKFLVAFSIFISNLSASAARWKTPEDVDLSESVRDADDSPLLVEKFDLKNNCILIMRRIIETEDVAGPVIYTQAYLQRDGRLSLLLDREDAISLFHGATKYLFRYEQVDFDDYFWLTQYEGAYYHYLFDKRNGKMVLGRFLGAADISHNAIFYLDENDEMILYDLGSGKKYGIEKYLVHGEYGSNAYWNDFKIVRVADDRYEISFENYDENGEEIPQLITIPK